MTAPSDAEIEAATAAFVKWQAGERSIVPTQDAIVAALVAAARVRDPEPPPRVAHAIEAGMTAAEADVWDKVGTAAGAYLRLTENEPTHHMEREEICHGFHGIQGWLAGRPFLRACGGATRGGSSTR